MKDEIFEYLQDKEKVSISILQRDLSIGFIKARELYDELINEGYVYKNGGINAWAVYDALQTPIKYQEIKDVLKKEEEMYYPKILNLIDLSPYYPTKQEARDRLAAELEIIHNQHLSKTIWYCFQVGKYARDVREPFFIGGIITSLYLLYVLGVLKYDPMETGCCYQTCLGTKDNPRNSIPFTIFTSRSSLRGFKSMIERLEPSDCIYRYGFYTKDKNVNHNPSSYILLPDSIDVERYYAIEKKEHEELPILVEKLNSLGLGVQISFVSAYMLSIYKIMNQLYPSKAFVTDEELIEDFEYLLEHKKFETDNYALEQFKTFNKPLSLNSVISLYCFMNCSHYKKDPLSIVFSDRDTLFNYLKNRGDFDEDSSYKLTEIVRRGMYLKSDQELKTAIANALPDRIVEDFKNTLYLTIRGHLAERIYYVLLLAHLYRHHEKEYLIIENEFKGGSV